MKYILQLSVIVLLMMQSCGVTHRMESRSALEIEPSTLDLTVDQSGFPYTVDVDYTLKVPKRYVATCAQVVAQPFFTDGVNTQLLTSIFINGSTFDRLEQRKMRFGQPTTDYTDAVKIVSKGKKLDVEMNEQVIFQPWMPSSSLIMATAYQACDQEQTLSHTTIAQGMEYFPQSLGPAIIPLEVKPEPFIKSMEWSGVLKYKINSSEINSELGTNNEQIHALGRLIDSIRSQKTVTLDRIVVCGISSPDGVYELNAKLAESRAYSLKDYIVSHYQIAADMIQTEYNAEDWQGLNRMITTLSVNGGEELIHDLDSASDNSTREQILRSSPAFAFIRANILPKLRKVTCTIYYKIIE